MIAAATASVSAVDDPDRTTSAGMVVNRVVVAAVFLVVPLLGGSFESIMWLLVGLGVSTFVLSRRLPPPAPGATVAAGSPPRTRILLATARGPAWALGVAFACWTVTDEGTYALIEIFVDRNVPGLSASQLSVVYAGAIITGLLGALGAPTLLRLVGRTRCLAVALGLSIVAKLFLATGTTPVVVLVAALVWGFAFGVILPPIFGVAAAAAPDGSVSVLVNGLYTVGVALGPLVGTQLFALGSTAGVGAALALIAVVGAVVTVIAVGRLDQPQGGRAQSAAEGSDAPSSVPGGED